MYGVWQDFHNFCAHGLFDFDCLSGSGGAVCDARPAEWEYPECEFGHTETVAIKNWGYLRGEPGQNGDVNTACYPHGPGEWEEWIIESVGNYQYTVKNKYHGTYLSARNNAGAGEGEWNVLLVDVASYWEKWYIRKSRRNNRWAFDAVAWNGGYLKEFYDAYWETRRGVVHSYDADGHNTWEIQRLEDWRTGHEVNCVRSPFGHRF